MMIKIKDLECYQKATEEQKNYRLVRPESGFDLSKLNSAVLQAEMEEYVFYRGTKISLSSARTELGQYNQFCRAMNEILPADASIMDLDWHEFELRCRKWLAKNNLPAYTKKKKLDRVQESTVSAPLINYTRAVYKFFTEKGRNHDFDDDVWYIDRLGVKVSKNPIQHVSSISFLEISQEPLRSEIKRIMKIQMREEEKALGTITKEMTSVKRFSRWLAGSKPEIDSLKKLDRYIIEEYLRYINLEATDRKDYSKDLCHLKSVLMSFSMITGEREIGNLIINTDIPRSEEALYKSYSDDEIRRLNKVIMSEVDEQIARALRLHQMLGTRISETLTLKRCNVKKSRTGKDTMTIYQIKSQKYYDKMLTPEMKCLIEESIRYTEERFGVREYIFVNEKKPDEPMTYHRIKYAMKKIIIQYDLRDDHGERFTVGTHKWRHTYARKLAEMDVDDMTIASMLGQSGTSSLKHYRKIAPRILAEKTKEVRQELSEEIKKIMEIWDDE